MGRRDGTYEAEQVLAHPCEGTYGHFPVFSRFFSFSSMPFFSLFIALNTENTYSRYQIECKRMDVSLNNRHLCPVIVLGCCVR